MHNKLIAGVDEAGRGPLAGPVVAAAVIFHSDRIPEGLRDSKKLSEKRREALSEQIRQTALAWSFGRCEVSEIDEFNILQASLIAMERAVAALSVAPDHVLVDGNRLPRFECTAEAIVKGDTKIAEISAASIIAKVERDQEMMVLHERFPEYGFDRHKGYPTAHHRNALMQYGVTEHHRQSYRPVQEALSEFAGELRHG
jgi:ribonuclease HII